MLCFPKIGHHEAEIKYHAYEEVVNGLTLFTVKHTDSLSV